MPNALSIIDKSASLILLNLNEGDKITLTKTTPPEPKVSKKSLEEKIKDLNENQRRKLEKMIDSL